MKQVQYRRAAQSTGFRPVQISGAEISRMQQESARVVQGMRDVRDAEIKNRESILAQTKEDQREQERQEDRNYKISTQNLQQEISDIRRQSQEAQQQFANDQTANASILKSISSISQSAGAAYEKYVVAKEDEQISEALTKYLENPDDEILNTMRSELGLDALDEMKQSQIDQYVANGGDPLAAAKARNYSDRVNREVLKGKAAYFYQYKYGGLLQEARSKEEERLGRPMTSAELAGFMADTGRIVADKFRTEGGVNLKPGSMRTALEYREKIHQGVLTKARADELKHENQITIDTATSILTQNPAEFATNIAAEFQSVYRANGYDYKAAHDWYVSLSTMRGPDGKYLFTQDQLANVVLKAGEKPYALERPGRFASIQQARLEDDTKFRKEQIKAEKLAYQEAEQNALQQLIDNPSQIRAEALMGYFRETYGKIPDSISKFAENYTVEAVSKATQIEELENMPDGFIIQEHVDALSRLDVQAGKRLDTRLQEQESKYNAGIFKQQSDAFKTVANGVTSFGTQKPNNSSSIFLQQEMRAEYRKRVDQAVAGGADFNTAANTIANQLETEVKAGARDPDSMWYRKPSKGGGATDFPNLSTGNVTAVEQARRNYQGIVKMIDEKGLEETLNTAESVLTRDEIMAIKKGYGQPGFVIPTDVLAVSGLGNGLDPFTIINRQILALGDSSVQPIEPPALIRNINETLSAEDRQSLFNAVNGPIQRVRALQKGAGTVARPSNLRAGFAGNSLKKSFTNALTYEGNRGAYQQTGQTLQKLGFQVAEHPDFGGVAPVHAGNSFHGYGEAFDITHQTGNREDSIEKTRQLKELIRSMNLFKEVIGPGDGDPRHATHLHLGGLMRPLTAEDIEKLNSFK